MTYFNQQKWLCVGYHVFPGITTFHFSAPFEGKHDQLHDFGQ